MLGRLSQAFIGRLRRFQRWWLLRGLPRHAKCAEIGVWKGDLSREIIRTKKPVEFHMIDPWQFMEQYPNRFYGGVHAKSQADMDAIYEAVRSEFGAVAKVQRGTSADVLRSLPDGHLDWVYIDGDHSYEAVLQDLELSWRKVHVGGVISGDDYLWSPDGAFPVKKAVQEFAAKHRAKVTVYGDQYRIKR